MFDPHGVFGEQQPTQGPTVIDIEFPLGIGEGITGTSFAWRELQHNVSERLALRGRHATYAHHLRTILLATGESQKQSTQRQQAGSEEHGAISSRFWQWFRWRSKQSTFGNWGDLVPALLRSNRWTKDPLAEHAGRSKFYAMKL
jgi:hypothetical protein